MLLLPTLGTESGAAAEASGAKGNGRGGQQGAVNHPSKSSESGEVPQAGQRYLALPADWTT